MIESKILKIIHYTLTNKPFYANQTIDKRFIQDILDHINMSYSISNINYKEGELDRIKMFFYSIPTVGIKTSNKIINFIQKIMYE